MRILIDMNLSPRWLPWLRDAGHDVVHWADIGPVDADDEEIMAEAVRQERAILTNDLDFGDMLVVSGSSGPSVVQLRSDRLRPSQIGELVRAALDALDSELRTGALVTIDARRARVRLLPLGAR